MIVDYTLDKVLDKIKRMGIEKLNDTRILIQMITHYDITSKNTVILITCVIMIKMVINFIHIFFKKKHRMMNKHNANHLKKIERN